MRAQSPVAGDGCLVIDLGDAIRHKADPFVQPLRVIHHIQHEVFDAAQSAEVIRQANLIVVRASITVDGENVAERIL